MLYIRAHDTDEGYLTDVTARQILACFKAGILCYLEVSIVQSSSATQTFVYQLDTVNELSTGVEFVFGLETIRATVAMADLDNKFMVAFS